MKNWQKIVINILWSIAAAALIVLFVVSWKAKSEKQLTDIQVELVGESAQALFMDEIAIRSILNEQGVKAGMPIEKINLTQLEKFIEKTEWVKNAEFFINNKLVLEVKIEQRIPIARVFTASGTSFYIDNEGSRLPLKQLTVLNLPVFTGFPTDQPKLSRPDSVLLKDVLFFAKTIQKDSFFMAQVAQVNIEPNGTFQMVPTLGDHLVLLGTVDQLEDKLNRLFTFYKKVWLVSGVNAYQYIDCRFNHQVVALKKGLQPIQFTGDFKLLAGDSTLMMQAPVASLDTTIAKTDSVNIVPVAPSPNSVKAVPAKIEKPNAPKAIAKKKVQVKGGKSKPKLNNKPKNNSLNKKNKTAKAIMPKKSKSPTKNN
ncbi:MAG: cell division protein FtsQ/DivIB [Sediminibacterium sp.]